FRCRVVGDDPFHRFAVGRVSRTSTDHVRIRGFVNQHVDSLSKSDQVLGHASISRQRHRMALVIDPVAKSRLYRAMINKKRGDLYAVLVKDDALLDVMAHHLDAVAWSSFVYVTPDMNIKGERLLEAIHHVARALGPPYLKRDLSPAASPTSQKQVRDLDHVVGM